MSQTEPTAFRYTRAEALWAFRYLRRPVESLLPELTDKTRVLDIGCGNGYWAGRFAETGCTVVGIDASKTGIALATQTYPQVRFVQTAVVSDICEQLGEERFDLVTSLEVVEHVYSPRQWATACLSALKPGGVLICSTPYHGYLKNLLISLAGKWDRHFSANREGGHIKFWSPKTLTRLLFEAGFPSQGLQIRGAGRVPYVWKSMVIRARLLD